MRPSNENRRPAILVTAFEPFGGEKLNPTELLLRLLPDEIGGAEIVRLLLPVEFSRAPELAEGAICSLSPSAVIMLGQAGGRRAITPERIARNLMAARIPDNAGDMPAGDPVIPCGSEILESTLPVDRIVEEILSLGIPAEASEDAGTYVCNALLYSVLAQTLGRIPAGFIHVPFIREQVEGVSGREQTPFMELEDIARAAEAAIRLVAEEL